MYVPSYLEYLDRSGTVDGWPKFVTDEAKAFAVEMVQRGFERFDSMTLDLASECIFRDIVREKGEVRPECLKLGLWDAIYAVTYRALLAADAAQTWRASSMRRAANLLKKQADETSRKKKSAERAAEQARADELIARAIGVRV